MADSTDSTREQYVRGAALLVEGRAREAVEALLGPAASGSPEASLALAKAHLELGEGAEAYDRLGPLMADPPADPGLHAYVKLLAARALASLGRPDEALRLLDEVARVDARMEPAAREMRRRLERGRSAILKF